MMTYNKLAPERIAMCVSWPLNGRNCVLIFRYQDMVTEWQQTKQRLETGISAEVCLPDPPNVAHVRQSTPDSGLDLQVKDLQTC